MITKTEDLTGTKKRLSLEIPSEAFEQEILKRLQDLRATMKLPGFRKGKVPLNLLEKRYGKEVESEAVEKTVSRFYSEALKEAGIAPIAQPVLEGDLDFKRNAPLNLTFTVEVRPDITVAYEGMEVTEIDVTVTDEDVDATLERLRNDKASFEPTENAIADGDVVIMDYTIVEDDRTLTDQLYRVGSPLLLPTAFTENLLGKKKGESLEFKGTFDAEHRDQALAGQTKTFKVTIKEVKGRTLPAMDDEFARDLEFDDLIALKAHVKVRLEESKQEHVRRIQKAELMQKVIDANVFDEPQTLVDIEMEQLLAQRRAQLGMYGAEVPEGAPAQPSEEDLKAELAPEAARRARATVLIDMIGEKENVQVNQQEMEHRVLELARQLNMSPENIVKYYMSKDQSLEGLRQQVFEDKVLEAMLQKATPVKAQEEKA